MTIRYDFVKSECPLVGFGGPTSVIFYLRPKAFNSVEDLLASLLADGYDLTPLQPFLEA